MVECHISHEDNEFYLIHSFSNPSDESEGSSEGSSESNVCLNKFVNVNMFTAQDNISISYRAFKFFSNAAKEIIKIIFGYFYLGSNQGFYLT